jgi:hypothetical protein
MPEVPRGGGGGQQHALLRCLNRARAAAPFKTFRQREYVREPRHGEGYSRSLQSRVLGGPRKAPRTRSAEDAAGDLVLGLVQEIWAQKVTPISEP